MKSITLRVIGALFCLFALFGLVESILSILNPERFTLGVRQPPTTARLYTAIVCISHAGLFLAGVWLIRRSVRKLTIVEAETPAPRHRPSAWVFIVSMLFVPILLMYIASLRAAQHLPQPVSSWLPTLRWVLVAISIVNISYIYLMERKLLTAIAARGPSKGSSAHEKLLIIGLGCSAVPAIYGFILVTLGAPFSNLVYFSIAAMAAVAVWSIRWLRQKPE